MKKPSILVPRPSLAMLAAWLTMATPAVLAHADAHATKADTAVSTKQHIFGTAAASKKVTRTIAIDMAVNSTTAASRPVTLKPV